MSKVQPVGLSARVGPNSAEAQLLQIDQLRAQLEENFHTYEEIKALPAADRDALFSLLWEAQAGDVSAIEALQQLVFDELPVPMDEFVCGKRYLGLDGLINAEKLDLLIEIDRPHVRKAFLAVGSGAGKSFIVSIMKARMVYFLLCLKRPDLYFMLGPGSKIAVVNLSVSKEQARDVIFSEFRARVEGSPWFAGKYQMFTSRGSFIKGVHAFSGGSNATSYYGYHTIFGSLDEASFLMDSEDRSLAEELSEALLKSLHTRFPRAFKLLVISTLRSPEDYLLQQIDRIREHGVRVS